MSLIDVRAALPGTAADLVDGHGQVKQCLTFSLAALAIVGEHALGSVVQLRARVFDQFSHGAQYV